MKSWGFSRMRKQWIPSHFFLLPRGLGTRLTSPVISFVIARACVRACVYAMRDYDGCSEIVHLQCEVRWLEILEKTTNHFDSAC